MEISIEHVFNFDDLIKYLRGDGDEGYFVNLSYLQLLITFEMV